MNTKKIIVLAVLTALTGSQCWGAARGIIDPNNDINAQNYDQLLRDSNHLINEIDDAIRNQNLNRLKYNLENNPQARALITFKDKKGASALDYAISKAQQLAEQEDSTSNQFGWEAKLEAQCAQNIVHLLLQAGAI